LAIWWGEKGEEEEEEEEVSSWVGEGGVVPKAPPEEAASNTEESPPSADAVDMALGTIMSKESPAPMCCVCLKSVGGPIILRSIRGLRGVVSELWRRTLKQSNNPIWSIFD